MNVCHKKAFLLFEVLIAILVLSVSTICIMRSFHQALSIAYRSVDFFKTSLLADEVIGNMLYAIRIKETFPEAGIIENKKINSEKVFSYSDEACRIEIPSADSENDLDVNEEESLSSDENKPVYMAHNVRFFKHNKPVFDIPIITREDAHGDDET